MILFCEQREHNNTTRQKKVLIFAYTYVILFDILLIIHFDKFLGIFIFETIDICCMDRSPFILLRSALQKEKRVILVTLLTKLTND